MIREIEVMKAVGKHDHIVSMIGCVAEPTSPIIASEFCSNGDLLKMLRAHKLHFNVSLRKREVYSDFRTLNTAIRLRSVFSFPTFSDWLSRSAREW